MFGGKNSYPLFWLLCAASLTAAGCDSSNLTATPTSRTIPSAEVESLAAEPTEPAVESAVSNRILEKTFDDIKFDIEPDAPFDRSMLTPEIEDLAGKRIRIRGYILPTAQKRGIKQFVLVRDNMECCFGPGAALYDCVLVEMQPDKTAEFSIRPVAVAGTFEIEEFKGPDGVHLAIYRMQGEEVE